LIQWSIRQRKTIKHYGDFFGRGSIHGILLTSDKKQLFIKGWQGQVIHVDRVTQRIIHHYKTLPRPIYCMTISLDNRYLFITGNSAEVFQLKQYRINDHKYIQGIELDGIPTAMVETSDRKFMFTGDDRGSLHKISFESGTGFLQEVNLLPPKN